MATYYISPSGNDSSPGAGTLLNPWKTLTKAKNSSVAGDTIQCAAGTYTNETVTLSGRIIQGAGATLTIFSGNNTWTVNTANNTINDLQITGVSAGTQAIIFQGAGTIHNVNRCIFRVSGSDFFYQQNALTLNFYSCLFIITGTASVNGILNNVSSALTLSMINCVITYKSATNNGSIFWVNSGITATIKNCIIYNPSGRTFSYVGSGSVTTTASYSDFYLLSGAPTATNSLTYDPLFVDAPNDNYNLRPTSPCINAGTLI